MSSRGEEVGYQTTGICGTTTAVTANLNITKDTDTLEERQIGSRAAKEAKAKGMRTRARAKAKGASFMAFVTIAARRGTQQGIASGRAKETKVRAKEEKEKGSSEKDT